MRFVVVGGGIGGVCCMEELCRLRPDDQVFLVSASTVLKGVDKVLKITRNIEEFEVVERDLASLAYSNLTVIQDCVKAVDANTKVLMLASGKHLSYDKLCICAGARPKSISNSPHVVTLRDTESIQDFVNRLQSAKRLVLIGNGGIALELVGAVAGVEVVWVLKHGHIGDAFFDVDAANFLLDQLANQQQVQTREVRGRTHTPLSANSVAPPAPAQSANPQPARGHAAGPKWTDSLPALHAQANVVLEYSSQVREVSSVRPPDCDEPEEDWPVYVELQSGKVYGADMVVSAVGVEPSLPWLGPEFERAADGGLWVDRTMQTSQEGVYAAGDCCTIGWAGDCPHWFQMRLWTQARIMGIFAAHNMAGVADELGVGFNFELFTHVTRFLGKKVVLLGLYNGQKLEHELREDMVMYSTATEPPNARFVRVLLLRGRMQGAVLIGETELEETFEHLILDQLDLSSYGPGILDPDMELEHIFD